MKKYLLVISLLLCTSFIFAQQKLAYILYNAKGKKVSYKKMIKQLSAAVGVACLKSKTFFDHSGCSLFKI